MACSKQCDKHKDCHEYKNNNSNFIFIVLILYILLAIVIGGSLFY